MSMSGANGNRGEGAASTIFTAMAPEDNAVLEQPFRNPLFARVSVVSFDIVPDLKASTHWSHGEWFALMVVMDRDISDLMSIGRFTWARYKVIHRSNRMFDPESRFSEVFPYGREYYLNDVGDPYSGSSATAMIRVYGRTIAILAGFNLDVDLGQHLPQNITEADVKDPTGRMVYQFSATDPSENINCIYDMKSLSGLWPWPRNAAEDLGAGDNDGDGDSDSDRAKKTAVNGDIKNERGSRTENCG